MWCSTRWNIKNVVQLGLVCVLHAGWSAAAWASANTPNLAAEPLSTPISTHAQLPGSRLQGEATLRYWGLRIYHARLWTLPTFRASAPLEQPIVLELEYLRTLKGQAIAERSLQEMRRAGNFTEAQAQRWLVAMQRIFPDVTTGDRISGQHLPGEGARFWYNGRAVGDVKDADFARLFFAIWLAPTTSEPAMRLTLLGTSESDQR